MSLPRVALSAALRQLRHQSYHVRCYSIQSSHRVRNAAANNRWLTVPSQRYFRDDASPGNEGERFLSQLEPTIKRLAVQKGLDRAEVTLEKLLACVRAAVSQAVSGDPNENFEITDHLEGMSVPQIFLLGQLLLEAAQSLGDQCYDLAAPALRQAALRGDVNAKYSYARMLLDGLGTNRDPAEAARLFREVVDEPEGHTRPMALFCLGSMHTHGTGVRMNAKKAIEYFEMSAETGVNMAYNSLGWLYLHGFGVVKDAKKAFGYFEKGAGKNDPGSQQALADCYIHGQGVEKDAAKACEWYEKAAAGGNPMAMHSLGVCYSVGDGVEMDMNRTVELWSEAAKKGLPESQINLGNLYASGRFVERDIEKARKLFRSASFSRPEAAELLKELDKEAGTTSGQKR